jgi:hypothetical protein
VAQTFVDAKNDLLSPGTQGQSNTIVVDDLIVYIDEDIKGSNQEGKTVTITDVCQLYRDEQICQNGGVCMEVDSEAMCNCSEKYTGDFCENLSQTGIKKIEEQASQTNEVVETIKQEAEETRVIAESAQVASTTSLSISQIPLYVLSSLALFVGLVALACFYSTGRRRAKVGVIVDPRGQKNPFPRSSFYPGRLQPYYEADAESVGSYDSYPRRYVPHVHQSYRTHLM